MHVRASGMEGRPAARDAVTDREGRKRVSFGGWTGPSAQRSLGVGHHTHMDRRNPWRPARLACTPRNKGQCYRPPIPRAWAPVELLRLTSLLGLASRDYSSAQLHEFCASSSHLLTRSHVSQTRDAVINKGMVSEVAVYILIPSNATQTSRAGNRSITCHHTVSRRCVLPSACCCPAAGVWCPGPFEPV